MIQFCFSSFSSWRSAIFLFPFFFVFTSSALRENGVRKKKKKEITKGAGYWKRRNKSDWWVTRNEVEIWLIVLEKNEIRE